MGSTSQQPGRDQEDAALTLPWFPRPVDHTDVRMIPPPGRWEPDQLYELLSDPDGVEWRDRVGVVGRADGSAKSSTRLLAAQGWVAKTRLDHFCASEEALRRQIIDARSSGIAARLWHPEKHWELVRVAHQWYALTVCPELRTLRQIDDITARMTAWAKMLELAVTVFADHGLGLDLNPANFGTAAGEPRLYYIDDETYPLLAERDVAGAIIARIPEEPTVECRAWQVWARTVVERLQRGRCVGVFSWERLCEEIARYPVAEQFEERRRAILDVFGTPLVAAARSRRASQPSALAARLTCVLADVHANLPALEAVLDAARSLGADSYLFLGDVVGYGPHPGQCIARLAELQNSTLVRGNHDHAIATGRLDVGMNRLARHCAEWTIATLKPSELEWLRKLPLEHLNDEWMAVHGAPRDPRKFLAYVYELTYEDNLRHLKRLSMPLCFYGHTHLQIVHAELATGPAKVLNPVTMDLSGKGPVLINPGSVGQPRDGDPRAAFAMWDRANRSVSFHRASYDMEQTFRDLRRANLSGELEERLSTGK